MNSWTSYYPNSTRLYLRIREPFRFSLFGISASNPKEVLVATTNRKNVYWSTGVDSSLIGCVNRVR